MTAFAFFLHPPQVLNRYLPVFGFDGTYTIVFRGKTHVSPTGEPLVLFVIGYKGLPYNVTLGQPAKHGTTGIWVITRIAQHQLVLGAITHTAAQVHAIQMQANAGNPSYAFYLHPYQVLQKNLAAYGFAGTWTLVTPSRATPVPTSFIGPGGHPTIRYTIRYAGALHTVTVKQLGRTGTGGAWFLTGIVRHARFQGGCPTIRAMSNETTTPAQDVEEIRRSEIRFRTIFEQSPVSTQIFAPDGRLVAVNRAWERRWGITLADIGEYNILQDRQLEERGVMPLIRAAFAGEAALIPAIRYEPNQTRPGLSSVPFRWASATIYPVRDEDGVIREIALMHEDITERKQAEEALRESEQRFRAIFQAAPVGISLVDSDGRYVAVNPARQQTLGYSEEELIGQSYLDVTHPDDIPYDLAINAEAREVGKNRYQLEKRFLRKNGSVIWSRITVSTVRDEDGEIVYSISVAEDITEQKAAQEELEKLYRLERMTRADLEQLAAERNAILRQIAEGIMITDPAGSITFVNEAARSIHGVAELGVGPDEYAEHYHLFTMDGSPYPSSELPLARAVLRGETIVGAQWRIRRPDGTEIVAEGSAAPVLSEDGEKLGAVLTIRDITAEYDLERQKDEFLSAAAHDLRTPLTTIKGRIQLLRRRTGRAENIDPDRLFEELSRVDASTTRMMSLINELLDVANIQIGRTLKLTRQPTDLVEIAETVAAEHHEGTGRHRVEVEAGASELTGNWDRVRLERMLSNLISNAIKYSPDGGTITVSVRSEADGRWAVLSVRDQGIGIPAADLPYIFERFRRGGNVGGRISGTGIGLAAVRRIVEEHGGTIGVQSREGEGTTFTVRLPLGE